MAYKRKRFSSKKFAGRPKRLRASMTKKARKSKANFAKRVKSVMLRVAEPKRCNSSITKTEMYHNSYVYFLMNDSGRMPAQSTYDAGRIGDQINMTSWYIRLVIGQKADRPNVTFRWLVVSVPKGSAYSYGQWFTATTANILLDDPNKDFVKVLKSGYWKPHNGSMDNAADEYVFAKRIYLARKKLIKFGPADAATTHNDDDVYFLLGAYDAYGTLVTDNIAYYQANSEINYRDP